MKQYFYVTPSNEQAGPVYPQDFSALGINASTLVFCQGLSGWTPAGQVPELAPYLQQPMAQQFAQQQYHAPQQYQAPQQYPQQYPQQQYPQQQYNAYGPAQPQYGYEKEKSSKNVPGILGFIFSLVSATLSWIPVVFIFAMIIWVPALVLSIIGVCKRPKALALIGLIITLVVLVFWIYAINSHSYYYNGF